jgi:hypothetical protein
VASWTSRAALPRLLNSRTTGPLFLTDRKARVPLPVRSLAKHARVSAEALYRHQADRDPAMVITGLVALCVRYRGLKLRSGMPYVGTRI